MNAQPELGLYKSGVVVRVCGISARQLQYWVERGVIEPAERVLKPGAKRPTHYYSFAEIVQVKTVAALRGAGVSLQGIKGGIEYLRAQGQPNWHSVRLLSNGTGNLFYEREARLVILSGKPGQLAFFLVSIDEVQNDVLSLLSDDTNSGFSSASGAETI